MVYYKMILVKAISILSNSKISTNTWSTDNDQLVNGHLKIYYKMILIKTASI